MIRQFKMGVRLLRYGFGLKMCVWWCTAFLGLGLLLAVFVPPSFGRGGIYFVAVNGIWIAQLIYSLSASNMIQASRWNKPLQTSIPAMLCFAGEAFMYVLMILARLPYILSADLQKRVPALADVGMTGLLLFCVMVYVGFAYKFFVAATVLFFTLFAGSSIVLQIWVNMNEQVLAGTPFWVIVAIGFLAIAAGTLVQYGIALLTYRYPISKKAQLRGLQKYMG